MGDTRAEAGRAGHAVAVVMACDARFVVPLAVTLRSLGRWYLTGQPALAYVLFDGIDEPTQQRVAASVGGGVHIRWLPAYLEGAAGLYVGRLFSRVMFAKMTLGAALPADAGRVVYLDADVLVRRPIEPLVALDLGGAPVGAVVDSLAGTVAHRGGVKAWRAVGLDGRTRMVNTGVLAIDLPRWRAADLDRRLLACSEQLGEELRWGDQDAINIVLTTEIAELPLTWNVLHGEAARASAYSLFPASDVDDAYQDPAIIHFATGHKPWTQGWNRKHLQTSAFFTEWWGLARETTILDLLPPRRSWRSWLAGGVVRARLAWNVFLRGPQAADT